MELDLIAQKSPSLRGPVWISASQSRLKSPSDTFILRIYEIKNAEMKDPPKENAWAFSYGPDAGERVLERSYQPPKLIHTFDPFSQDLANFIEQPIEVPVNYGAGEKHGLTAVWKGQKVFVDPNYRNKKIDVAIKSTHDIRKRHESRLVGILLK